MSLLSWTIFKDMYKKGKDCNSMYLEFKDNTSIAYQTEEELQKMKNNISKNETLEIIRDKLFDLKNKILGDETKVKEIIKNLSDNNIIESFKKYWSLYENIVFGMGIDIFFDDILCSELSNVIKEKTNDENQYNKIITNFTAPIKLTRSQKEEVEFLQILKSEEPDFKSHLDKWSFIPMWFDNSPWTLYDLKKRAKLFKGKVNDRLNELLLIINKRKKERQRIIKELSLKKETIELIYVISEFAFLRQEGELQISQHKYMGLPIFKIICNKLNLSSEELKFLTDKEIIENLKNPDSTLKKIIKERQKYCFVIFKDSKTSIYTGDNAKKQAEKIKEQIPNNKINRKTLIKGVAGSSGKTKARVFVINSLNDINNFPAGDIMVVSGTSVEYISVMQKCSGIITEFGGITSHAAVIARELNKPCIIQVKNATRLFKNDDFIELDADKGIITFLNK